MLNFLSVRHHMKHTVSSSCGSWSTLDVQSLWLIAQIEFRNPNIAIRVDISKSEVFNVRNSKSWSRSRIRTVCNGAGPI